VWTSLGLTKDVKIAAARAMADTVVERIHQGLSAQEVAPAAETLGQVADAYMAQRGSKQRCYEDKRRRMDRWIPILGGRDTQFQSITRQQVEAMLDKIEVTSVTSRRGADMALVDLQSIDAILHKACSCRLPVRNSRLAVHREAIRGRAARSRAEGLRSARPLGCRRRFGVVLKLALYSAQRIDKILSMEWQHINLDTGEWEIPRIKQTMKKWIPGEKGVPDVLPLPPAAVELIRAQLVMKRGKWVFPSVRGHGHMIGLSVAKRELNARMLEIEPRTKEWRVHDLRRTSRTLMSELDVPFHVGERVLGHKLSGVAGTYDRAKLEPQMRTALVTLANHIGTITDHWRERDGVGTGRVSTMTDEKPEPTVDNVTASDMNTKKSSRGLVIPASWHDVTVENAGKLFAIVGAQHLRQRTPVDLVPERQETKPEPGEL
jgi:integrase